VEHRKNAAIEWTPAPPENFTGDVWFGTLSQDNGPEGLYALGVSFTPSARTDWHSHPDGQVLYIASGAGLVANDEGDRVEVAAGDVVYTPAGELHWHGATPKSPMVHLSLTTGGATAWEPRKVTDAEYDA
jgi:quercetin dioxygenase-like cupin family protein